MIALCCTLPPLSADQKTSRADLQLLRSFLSPLFLLCSCLRFSLCVCVCVSVCVYADTAAAGDVSAW